MSLLRSIVWASTVGTTMNERGFKAKLRRLIKPQCHIQSVISQGEYGTPDLWLSKIEDLWLEVKYDGVTKGAIKPKLSRHQLKWLNDRHREGRNVAVLVGVSPDTAILYMNGEWNAHSNNREPLQDIITKILKDM